MEKEIKFNNEMLFELRKKQGLSQEELANKIDVSRQAISKWENGEKIPDLENINKICKLFEIDISEIVEGIYKKEEINTNIENIAKANNIKKNTLQKWIIAIFVFIMFAYIISVTVKAVLFSYILNRNNMNNIKSYQYSNFDETYCFGEENISSNYTITCKEENSCFIYYAKNKNFEIFSSEYYMKNGEKIELYGTGNRKINGEEENEYVYDTDVNNINRIQTPFELITDIYKDEFSIKNIINPLKFYEISNGYLIIKIGNQEFSKIKLYIKLTDGLLYKIEGTQNEEISYKSIYEDYRINNIEDEEVIISEYLKKEILEHTN